MSATHYDTDDRLWFIDLASGAWNATVPLLNEYRPGERENAQMVTVGRNVILYGACNEKAECYPRTLLRFTYTKVATTRQMETCHLHTWPTEDFLSSIWMRGDGLLSTLTQ